MCGVRKCARHSRAFVARKILDPAPSPINRSFLRWLSRCHFFAIGPGANDLFAALVAGMIITIALLSLPAAFIRYVPVEWSDQSAPRIAASEECVPASFGGVVSLDLNKCPRNEPNKSEHEPTNGRSIYYGSGYLIPAFDGIRRRFS